MCNVTRVRRLPTLSPSSVTACGGATFPRQGGKAYRCDYRDYCAVMQVPVSEAFPLTGEGGTAKP